MYCGEEEGDFFGVVVDVVGFVLYFGYYYDVVVLICGC